MSSYPIVGNTQSLEKGEGVAVRFKDVRILESGLRAALLRVRLTVAHLPNSCPACERPNGTKQYSKVSASLPCQQVSRKVES